MTPPIAALYVHTDGPYYGLPGVEPWDEARDARRYNRSWPVVAHPPCARWSRLAGFCESFWGLKRGEDGGCFASALRAVRMFGGVLEHPAGSAAWKVYGLPRPLGAGGWAGPDHFGGYACQVEQGHYGHLARKATWLYAARTIRPGLAWGPSAAVGVIASRKAGRRHIPKRLRHLTPFAFRDLLIDLARSVYASYENATTQSLFPGT